MSDSRLVGHKYTPFVLLINNSLSTRCKEVSDELFMILLDLRGDLSYFRNELIRKNDTYKIQNISQPIP